MSKQTIFRKLVTDFWSIVCLVFIGVCAFVALFAYAIAPDNSKQANQMHLPIHSKPPGFSVQILHLPNKQAEESSFFETFFFGKNTAYDEIPITNYKTDDKGIYYTLFLPDGSSGNTFFVPWQIFTEPSKSEIIHKNIKTKTFWLGTDKYGRDMLSRMLIGTRISFTIGFVAVTISLIVGILLGSLAGYYGGRVDALIMWLINVVWAIPTLLLVIAFTLALGKGYWQVFVAVGLTMWVEVARVVRGQIFTLKKAQFVEAAKVLGFSDIRILIKHILPNIYAPLIVISAANFASAILIESGLSFLGIGSQPPNPSWGSMIKDHYNYIILGKPFLAIIPGLAIMSLVMAFMLLGNKLRDVLDVRQ
ncbi:Oligopeptide transport system permease protein appC [Capnocytophaga canimorsus]|uniref:Oligopeptide transport system permease protein appC n=1 Tax=Capnocytophaga canimorsus TaxID=28188 RepID=A0A0B7HAK9_9FLAO|nr:ABC transporter permease [Capnocytophaga canimorsus]ATA76532.1 ABC transporter permease [Capnocytophaga canimorsus]PJI77294.1 peptide/nickel transport system permease protein [Capnocytophaga canimorsus]CEN35574.1 Oligopeptide transport system permease protein appC [Capnocytophaga canimorsus]STA71691.1 Glutathione transport system permease protein gsiD [Capnocytophaga canimorsus]